MIKKSILYFTLATTLITQAQANYKHGCPVPDILIETIKLTENESSHPYLIRTNDTKNLKKFQSIVNKYSHEYPYKNDNLVIDCKSEDNCASITNDLIKSGITNIDLGLFQINYDSYKYNLYSYFDEQLGYTNACKVVLSKLKMTKNWSWETLAAYHSLTPHLNKKYRDKLITNYKLLSNKKPVNSKSNSFVSKEKKQTTKKESVKTFNDGKSFFSGSEKYVSNNITNN